MISVRRLFVLLLLLASPVATAFAQQTGAIAGRVTDSGGLALPGVTIEARSDVLPTARETVSGDTGDYRLPALPPGTYTLTFTLSGMQTVTRQAQVQLALDTTVDATLNVGGVTETVTVTAATTLVERESATIKSGVSNEQISSLPVGQEYRDLIKLIPGVQVTNDTIRGPSAGGSGQDNVYQFDGVNVTLPLFGTLSAEPSSHDISQITIVKGNARAVDFDRAGGFTIDTVSKSGSSRYTGEIGFQFQEDTMAANVTSGSASRYEQDRSWIVGNGGGPILKKYLFFYGSYYRPERQRANRANLYGELPPYESERDEFFVKLTATPVSSLLLNVSYRDSVSESKSDLFDQAAAATTGTGDASDQTIGILEGSWIVNTTSLVTFKYNRYALETSGIPDFLADVVPSTAVGTRIDLNNLDQLGRLTVPVPVAGQTAYNAFVQPIIARYGYPDPVTGVQTGGGTVGYGLEINDQDFFRTSGQAAYNLMLGSTVVHDLHAGYQQYVDREELIRGSNGWGGITVPGGRLAPPVGSTQPAFYSAAIQAQGLGSAVPIKSEYHSKSIEINDTIRWARWTFNAGVLMSKDTLYGQGLRNDDSTLSGFVIAPGNKYKMYEIGWGKLLQPRLGATWAYNGSDTVFGGYAQYNPAASSLPRAASWDRNLTGLFVDVHFDANGVLFASVPRSSSSGKLFVKDLTPRTVDEFVLGTAKQFNSQWSGRLFGRYREATHFWEDTNNNARVIYNPPAGIPRTLYVEDLAAQLAQIGTAPGVGPGSSYVIADLDGSFTKFYEATAEAEYRTSKLFVRGSYTWSKYYGNFDQDNNTGAVNDASSFIGSSNIADSAGRQLWDFKHGTLRGDRPHLLKVYGYYNLAWNATAGAFFVAQSGQPWEAQSYEPYIALTTNTSDSNRFAEPAGSRRTPSHYQMDLKYIQNVRLMPRLNVHVELDLFNVFDKQTGYNFQPSVHTATFGTPRNFYDPRRLQIAIRLQF